MNIGSEYWCKF